MDDHERIEIRLPFEGFGDGSAYDSVTSHEFDSTVEYWPERERDPDHPLVKEIEPGQARCEYTLDLFERRAA